MMLQAVAVLGPLGKRVLQPELFQAAPGDFQRNWEFSLQLI
jgi:hypothetical protein